MNGWIYNRGLWLACLALVIFCQSAAAEHNEERTKALAKIRTALAGRLLPEFTPAVEAASKLKGEPSYDQELQRLEYLTKYVTGFWEAVDAGAKNALNVGEMKVGDQLCAVVDYDRRVFVIRSLGENKRYTIETIPAKLALVISQLHLLPESPDNKVFFGAFLAMDAKGDRKIAEQYWKDAIAGGVNIEPLLPELKVDLAAAPVKLPEVTPAMKLALQPTQWQYRWKKGEAWQREPLNKHGEQPASGRLQIKSGEGDAESAVLTKARLAGDFNFRMTLGDVQKGQTVGLFPALPSDSPVLIPLPEGNVMVEFMRKKGVFYARINERDVLVEPKDKNAGKMAGFFGVNLVAGQTLTIGAFETLK